MSITRSVSLAANTLTPPPDPAGNKRGVCHYLPAIKTVQSRDHAAVRAPTAISSRTKADPAEPP